MKIAFAQINTTVGDFSGNLSKVRASLERGREQAAVDVAGRSTRFELRRELPVSGEIMMPIAFRMRSVGKMR